MEEEALIIRGWINIEHLRCGLPGEHFKTKEHRFLIVRSNPTKLLRHSIEPVFVRITIERELYDKKFSKFCIHQEKNGFRKTRPPDSYIGEKRKTRKNGKTSNASLGISQKKINNRRRVRQNFVNTYGL